MPYPDDYPKLPLTPPKRERADRHVAEVDDFDLTKPSETKKEERPPSP